MFIRDRINSSKKGEVVTKEPAYYQTAASHGAQEWGTTYVEVDLSAQHMWYIVDGNVALETDVVTGDVYKRQSVRDCGSPHKREGDETMNLRKKAAVVFCLCIFFLAAVCIGGSVLQDRAALTDFTRKNQIPSLQFFFGTDWMGRDMWARTLSGLSASIGTVSYTHLDVYKRQDWTFTIRSKESSLSVLKMHAGHT